MDVEIKLDGKAETLRCTLKAAKRVSSAGGFSHVVNRLQASDLEMFCFVAAAGLDKRPPDKIGKSGPTVEEAVYLAGMPALAGKLIEYVNLLANGGRPYRPMKLKTIEIDGKTYAEVEGGQPVYVEEEEPAGEGGEGEA